jgi:hypothetical protein
MNIGVAAEASPLSQFFSPGRYYKVPAFQRSYAWDDADALELLSDLRDGLEGGYAHFVGSIVLVRDGETFEIVDGQQRLTTLTIILCALRDLMRAGEPGREDIRKALCDDTPKSGARWRLTLNEFDAPFFRASVQDSGATLLQMSDPDGGESRDRLSTNTDRIVRELRKLTPQERADLARHVLDGCSLVTVFVDDREAAQRVFRVLNNRGKLASDHDIVKTELFEKAGLSAAELAEYARRWSEYEARIRGKGMDDLLTQIRTIVGNGNRNTRVLGFRRVVMGRFEPREFLDMQLPAYVEATEAINANAIPGFNDADGRIYAALRHLSTIEHLQWRAPALKFLVERKGDIEGARAFFPLLERLGFALQLVVTDRDHRAKRYRRVLDAVEDDRILFDGEGPLAISEEEGERVAERLLGRFTSFSQRRAMVLRLNAALQGGEVIPASADVSVEHVLPRNPEKDSYWLTVWPNSALRAQLCETLGNYVLLPALANQKADRLNFREKKEIYFSEAARPAYAVTREMRGEDLWSPDVVRRRSERLVNALLRAWGLMPLA